jgi:hypothetical protein
MSPQPDDAHAERDRLAQLYLAIFEDDLRGAAIFEDLFARFGRTARVHTTGGIDAVLKTYRDAAHREVLDHIVLMINRARGIADEPVDPPQPTDMRTL